MISCCVPNSADVGLGLTPSLGMDFMLVFNFTNIIKGNIKSKSVEQSGQAEVFLLALLLSVFQSSVRMSAWVCVEVEGGGRLGCCFYAQWIIAQGGMWPFQGELTMAVV